MEHRLIGTKDGTVVGGISTTGEAATEPYNHHLRFTVDTNTPFSFEGGLTGDWGGAPWMTFREVDGSTLFFGVTAAPFSGTLTPGEYEIIVNNLGETIGNGNYDITFGAHYTLDFPDATSFTESNTEPTLTNIAPAPNGVVLTIDHGTHDAVDVERSADLETWTTIATAHTATQFIDSDGDPRAFYRVTVAP